MMTAKGSQLSGITAIVTRYSSGHPVESDMAVGVMVSELHQHAYDTGGRKADRSRGFTYVSNSCSPPLPVGAFQPRETTQTRFWCVAFLSMPWMDQTSLVIDRSGGSSSQVSGSCPALPISSKWSCVGMSVSEGKISTNKRPEIFDGDQ
jgi:hypothetical protein